MIAGGFVGENGRNVHPTAAAGGSLTRLRALRATQMKGCPASSTPSTVATTKGSRHPLRFPTPQYLQHSLQQGRAAAGAAAPAGVGMGWWALRSGCPLLFPHARELYQSGNVCAQVPGSTLRHLGSSSSWPWHTSASHSDTECLDRRSPFPLASATSAMANGTWQSGHFTPWGCNNASCAPGINNRDHRGNGR